MAFKRPTKKVLLVLFYCFVFTLKISLSDAAAVDCCKKQHDSASSSAKVEITATDEASVPPSEDDDAIIPILKPIQAPNPLFINFTTGITEVKHFFRKVECTLEKAKPWVEEFEKEAKRFEQTAKRFGEGVLSTITGFMDKLFVSPGSGAHHAEKKPADDVVEQPADVFEVIETSTTLTDANNDKQTPTASTTKTITSSISTEAPENIAIEFNNKKDDVENKDEDLISNEISLNI